MIALHWFFPFELFQPSKFTVGLFSNVQIHRKVLVRGIHDSTPPVNDGGYQGATVRYSLDEVEDGECSRHDDLRVVVEPG